MQCESPAYVVLDKDMNQVCSTEMVEGVQYYTLDSSGALTPITSTQQASDPASTSHTLLYLALGGVALYLLTK